MIFRSRAHQRRRAVVVASIDVGSQRDKRAQRIGFVMFDGVENRRAAGEIRQVYIGFTDFYQVANHIAVTFGRSRGKRAKAGGRVAVVHIGTVGNQKFYIVKQPFLGGIDKRSVAGVIGQVDRLVVKFNQVADKFGFIVTDSVQKGGFAQVVFHGYIGTF